MEHSIVGAVNQAMCSAQRDKDPGENEHAVIDSRCHQHHQRSEMEQHRLLEQILKIVRRARVAQNLANLFTRRQLLRRDALAPAALTFMSDRAARRLCDRLVSLGAARELTGRDTFRLYGL